MGGIEPRSVKIFMNRNPLPQVRGFLFIHIFGNTIRRLYLYILKTNKQPKMKTPRPKKQPKVKTPKPKKVTVFYKVNEFNKKEINELMYAKISDKFETIKHKFETALNGLKGMLDMENPYRPTIDNSLRQDFGYHLLEISGKDIKLYSLEAFNLKKLKKLKTEEITDEKIIADHFFGCLCFTNIMLIDFINCNYDINYMVNEWLRKHLYLWVVIRVTKKEHKIITTKAAEFHDQENPNYKLEYDLKLKREHYKEVSDIGFLVKE